MKKIALFILISTFLFGLVGCGSIDNTTMLSSVPEEAAISQSRQEIPSDEQNVNTEEEIMKILVKSEGYEIIYELNDSWAAKELYEQLPLTTEVEPFSNNEMTFYPEKLNTEDENQLKIIGGEKMEENINETINEEKQQKPKKKGKALKITGYTARSCGVEFNSKSAWIGYCNAFIIFHNNNTV